MRRSLVPIAAVVALAAALITCTGLLSADPAEALVTAGRPLVNGSMPRELIERVVARHLDHVQRCYEKGLARKPGMAGRVTIKLVISAAGTVPTATVQDSTVSDERVERCIVAAVMRWR